MRLRTLALLLVLITTPLHGATTERVLLPVAVLDVPGANGSVWRSELWANVREAGVVVRPLLVADLDELPVDTTSLPIALRRAGQSPGLFLHVGRERIDAIDFNLRVWDRSRAHETWGTEIPVIRESAFRNREISLMPLPVETGFRNMVRIYANDAGTVRVRITTLEHGHPERLMYDADHTLEPAPSVYVAPYLQIAVEDVIGDTAATRLRVDITPLNDGLRIWAFASTTHNETQHFTTITPQ